MPRIRDKKKPADKVQQPLLPPLDHIVFSLKYLTSNGTHSLAYFGKDFRKSQDAHAALIERMQELCQLTISEARARGKISGSEHIPYKQLRKSMQGICDTVEIISKDSDLTVFRFRQNDYRILCKADLNHANLMHIIAFDFDFSAYDHG